MSGEAAASAILTLDPLTRAFSMQLHGSSKNVIDIIYSQLVRHRCAHSIRLNGAAGPYLGRPEAYMA